MATKSKFPRIFAIALLLCLAVPFSRQTARAETPEMKSRWEKLSEAEKNRLRENFRHWQAMSPDARKKVWGNWLKFRSLPEAERNKVIARYNFFKTLPPERQQKIEERFEEFMKLPASEREKRIEVLEQTRLGDEGKQATPKNETENKGDENQKPDTRHRQIIRKHLKKSK